MYKYKKYVVEDDKKKSEKIVRTVIDTAEVQKSITKAAVKLQSEAKIKGFRSGHAPMETVMANYQTEILEESSRDLFNDLLDQIIKLENFNPLSTTQVESEKGENETESVLVFRIPVYPEVEIPDISAIKLTIETPTATDEEIEEGVKRIWANYSKDEKMVFTDDIFKEMIIPGVETEANLRDWVKNSIIQFKESQIRSDFGKRFLDEALQKSEIPVHEVIVTSEITRREAELVKVAARNNMSLEDVLKMDNVSMDEYKSKIKEEIIRTVQAEIFLRELAKQWNVEVTTDEIEEELKRASHLSTTYPNDPEYVKEIVRDAVLRDNAYHMMLDKYFETASVKS